MSVEHNPTETTQQQRLQALATVFFKLGLIAFGGPAAHIAMMDDEIVARRRWISRDKLLDLFGVTSLIPGPNSTELAIHIGYEYGGWSGLFVAGFCFIFPAMMMVWMLAAVYAHYQSLPQLENILYGIKPVIIAIVIQALWKLGNKAAKDLPTRIIGIIVIISFFLGVNEILLLFLAGLGVMLFKHFKSRGGQISGIILLPISETFAQVNTASPGSVSPHWSSVFFFFLKVGSVLYGSGYVLLAFLQRDLVERWQWLTSQELLDAVAVGQLTPGPVFTTATFVGYLVAGNRGAIAATVGIFLPAFLLVGLINPWVEKLRQSSLTSSFLDGVNAASLGLMAVVTMTLAQAAIIDLLTILLLLLSLFAVFRLKINSAWLVIAGGVIGFVSDLFVSI
ncbi:MAG: chromate efflux transporter [Microcoleaceae cyanobacterium]